MDTHTYQIQVRGYLDEQRLSWFANLAVSYTAAGETVITASHLDQAALHALLNRIRDLGVELLALQVVPPRGSPDGRI
jgi:hypothetical protein